MQIKTNAQHSRHYLMISVLNWTMLFNLGLFALATGVLFVVSPSLATGTIFVGAVVTISTRLVQPLFSRYSIESALSMDNAGRKAAEARRNKLTLLWSSTSCVGGLLTGVGILFFAISL